MSQPQRATQQGKNGPALGSRENFYASEADEYDPDRDTQNETRPTHGLEDVSSDQKLAKYAYELLVSGQARYCPDCQHAEGADHELGRKEATPKEQDTGRRVFELPMPVYRRTCPECGRQYFAGQLDQRPIDEFLDVVNEVLAAAKLPQSLADDLRGHAKARKQRGVDDQTNITRLLREIQTGGGR